MSKVPIPSDKDTRYFSREQCAHTLTRLLQFVNGGGETKIVLHTWWNGELRWARNAINLASNRRDIQLNIYRRIGRNGLGQAMMNQVDDASLEAVMQRVEADARNNAGATFGDWYPPAPQLSTPSPAIWSDATMASTIHDRSALVNRLIDEATSKDFFSAGYLEVRGASLMTIALDEATTRLWKALPESERIDAITNEILYSAYTQAQCSLTIRHPKGIGAGWGGACSFDWNQVDVEAIGARALDKCLQSIDPVRIEPGRYTVVLEPQAVADLVDFLVLGEGEGALYGESSPIRRANPEGYSRGPFYLDWDSSLQVNRTKLGLRVIDPRISIDHDPMDPRLGVVPEPGLGPRTWIDSGVLVNLAHDREFAVEHLGREEPTLFRPGYRMSGGMTSISEMISSTTRGLLVTRFSNLRLLDESSSLLTGVTRDGLWLIEKGKISRAVKNMRITESPLFVLNNVEQLGEPVSVFRPVRNPFQPYLSPVLVPPIKARDFSFTSITDAI